MQYLAEVQKVQGFVGSKSALKLLARNNNEVWQTISGEQIVSTDANLIKDFKDGQLVLADIVGSNQVQGIQDATRKIINTLQSLTRVQDKYKIAEDEIEQWKKNLQYQAQELHKREQELEQREIELENLEIIREEIEKAQQELIANQQRFEEMRQELEARGKGLAAEQLGELLDICDRLANSLSGQALAQSALQAIYNRQNVLNQFWQELETGRAQLQQEEAQVHEQLRHWQAHRQRWQEVQKALLDVKTELELQSRLLQAQEQHQNFLKAQLLGQETLHQQLANLAETMGGAVAGDFLTPEEIERLENMPIEELEAEINRLEASFQQDASFLTAQEEELADIEGEIAELRSRIEMEKDFAKKLEMEAELASLQEEYDFQEESISGQRQTFQQRQAVLQQQKAILERRQNPASSSDTLQVLMNALSQIDDQRQRLKQEIHKLEGQISTTRTHLQRQQQELAQQQQQQSQEEQNLQAEEQALRHRYRSWGEAVSKVAVQEAILRPVQDVIDHIRPMLEQMVNTGDSNPQDLLHHLRQTLQSLSA